MGIEDRDWYREEAAKRNGHRAVHEWGKKKTATGPTLDGFLKAEREIDKDVYYNPKEFRGSKKRGYSPPLPRPRYVKLTTAFYLALFFSVLSIASTFVATLVIALEKPEIFIKILETGLKYLKSLGW